MTIVDADAVAANAAAIAIWLFWTSSVWDGGECNLGHCVVFLCYLHQSSWLRREYIIDWDVVGAALDGRDISRCVLSCFSCVVLSRLRLAVGSHVCMMAGLSVTL